MEEKLEKKKKKNENVRCNELPIISSDNDNNNKNNTNKREQRERECLSSCRAVSVHASFHGTTRKRNGAGTRARGELTKRKRIRA